MVSVLVSCCSTKREEIPQRQSRLNPEQKSALRRFLSLDLKHPEFPNAVKGLPGMLVADRILKRRNAVGLLIGGLSEAIQDKNRTKEDLSAHKDVDVLVVNREFRLRKPFEGGIDWWLPKCDWIPFADREYKQTWLENGNGVILNFQLLLHVSDGFLPGLYLMNPKLVAKMRLEEVIASSVPTEPVDNEVRRRYLRLVQRRMKASTPPFLEGRFHLLVGCGTWVVSGFSPDQVAAIRRFVLE